MWDRGGGAGREMFAAQPFVKRKRFLVRGSIKALIIFWPTVVPVSCLRVWLLH